MTRTETLQELTTHLATLNDDELTVVTTVAGRMSRGRVAYGPLDIARDGRDMAAEILEEVHDGLAYAALALMKIRAAHEDLPTSPTNERPSAPDELRAE